jgi:F420-non-reducing hydrogenase iron-sulfur subunit
MRFTYKENILDGQHPKILCFSCKFSWGYLTSDEEISSRVKNWVPVICSGKIQPSQILRAFENGADGILILACPEGECHYQDGNCEARKKVFLIRKILAANGIDGKRLKMAMGKDPDGASIPKLIEDMGNFLKNLGPVSATGDEARRSSSKGG